MSMKIQRGRQFLPADINAPLFEANGRTGSYLKLAGEKLANQNIVVALKGQVLLKTADDWTKFIEKFASSKDVAANFAEKFGITFNDFANIIDDAAAGDSTGLKLNLVPRSKLSQHLGLDAVDNDYAHRIEADAKIGLTGLNGRFKEDASVETVKAIGPEIIANVPDFSWDRDRIELETWKDFVVTQDDDFQKFRRNTGIRPFEKLYQPKWDDPEAMAIVERFVLPLHPEAETDANGQIDFQDRNEMFRDVYFDDSSGALSEASASARARVRFEDDPPHAIRRVLIQGKEGREVNGDNSAVHKVEDRQPSGANDDATAASMLQGGTLSDGTALNTARMIYKAAKDAGTLPADEKLRLEPQYTVLQKRRRSHLQLANSQEVDSRLQAINQEISTRTSANEPVPEALEKYKVKLSSQLTFLKEAESLLSKYSQFLGTNFDAFIISADRYFVYDPHARATLPMTVGDNADDEAIGRIGRGLHVEAEWDAASSEGFEKAIVEARKQLDTNPPNADEIRADIKRLEEMSAIFVRDVQTTVEILGERLSQAGLQEDLVKKSKDDRAEEMAKTAQRPIYWE